MRSRNEPLTKSPRNPKIFHAWITKKEFLATDKTYQVHYRVFNVHFVFLSLLMLLKVLLIDLIAPQICGTVASCRPFLTTSLRRSTRVESSRVLRLVVVATQRQVWKTDEIHHLTEKEKLRRGRARLKRVMRLDRGKRDTEKRREH